MFIQLDKSPNEDFDCPKGYSSGEKIKIAIGRASFAALANHRITGASKINEGRRIRDFD